MKHNLCSISALCLIALTSCSSPESDSASNSDKPDPWVRTEVLAIRKDPPSILDDGPRPPLAERIEEWETYIAEQQALLVSPVVLQAALRQMDVAEIATITAQDDPVSWLSDHIEIERNGELLQIRVPGIPDEDAASLLRAVVDAYFQQVVNQERTARQDRLHHQKDLLRTLEDEVKSKKMSLRNLGELAGSLPADDSRIAMRRKFVLDRIERTLEKLFETRNRLREHEVEFEMSVAEGETATQRITELDKEIRKEQVLEKILGEELKQLEATVAKSTKPQDSYDLESLRAEIKVDEEILDRLRRQIAEQSIELHAPPRVSLLSPGS